MSRIIKIDPITRLEGHGNIRIEYDESGHFKNATLQLPDFRGFEKFCEGRAVEELPALTQKICGVCPTAHHIAGVKALDDMFGVTAPPAALIIRELIHNIFFYEDHLLHFYYLGGPDLFLPSGTPGQKRNIFSVINCLGKETGSRLLNIRKRVREMHSIMSGSVLYPVCGLPGGVSRAVSEEDSAGFIDTAKDALDFARFSVDLFHEQILGNDNYKSLLTRESMNLKTFYMGMVDDHNKINFYDGLLRVVDREGKEFCRFSSKDYLIHLAEQNNPESFMKYTYLRQAGWKGINHSKSGIYRVGPLARLNASSGFSTPLAQKEYIRMGEYFGGYPVHSTFAYHWARLIEVIYAAENMVRLTAEEKLTDKKIRNLQFNNLQGRGVGTCEAPRGTLIHDYESDDKGITRNINLLVATQNNGAAIQLSLSKAGRELFKNKYPDEETMNRLEMVFRAYDPCMACATH